MSEETLERSTTPPGKVVLIQTAYVGDVVFTSPLIHAIKTTHPQTHLSLMVRPDKAEVAACIPGVDEVLTFDKRLREAGLVGLMRVARRLKRRQFDWLVAPHRSSRTAMLAKLSGIPVRVGFSGGLRRYCYTHQVKYDRREPCGLLQEFRLLAAVGVEEAGWQLRLKAPEQQHEILETFLRSNNLAPGCKLVGMCIGSVWPTKRWPPVYFGSLAESLVERGYQPVLFGGREEVGLARQVTEIAPGKLVSCVGNSLAESAALLERCQMVVGGDTGLTHMARALMVPTAIIYGPTGSRQHRFGEHVKVLTARVKCRPCSRHGQNRCPERHHDCMRLVSPEQVMDAFRDVANLQTPVPPVHQEDMVEAAPAADPVPLP